MLWYPSTFRYQSDFNNVSSAQQLERGLRQRKSEKSNRIYKYMLWNCECRNSSGWNERKRTKMKPFMIGIMSFQRKGKTKNKIYNFPFYIFLFSLIFLRLLLLLLLLN